VQFHSPYLKEGQQSARSARSPGLILKTFTRDFRDCAIGVCLFATARLPLQMSQRLGRDNEVVDDEPIPGLALVCRPHSHTSSSWELSERQQGTLGGSLQLPAIIYGAGTFSNQYNSDEHLSSDTPLQTVRLAFRCACSPPSTCVLLTSDIIGMAFEPSTLQRTTETPKSWWEIFWNASRANSLGSPTSWCVTSACLPPSN